jgi:hypothetical protein
MDIIDLPAFYLLMTHIEEKDKSFSRIKNLFERNCELIAISMLFYLGKSMFRQNKRVKEISNN